MKEILTILSLVLLLATPTLAASLSLDVQTQEKTAVAIGGWEDGEKYRNDFNLTLTAHGPDDKPVAALIHLRVWHENEYGLFVTDIPYVEGQLLFEAQNQAPDGRLNVVVMPTVAGTYVLDARAEDPTGKFESVDIQMRLPVDQIPERQLRGALLLGFMTLAGFAGGYFFLREAKHE